MEEVVEVTLPHRGKVVLPRVRLPDDFLNWQSEARLDMFQKLEMYGAKEVRMAPAHLPVLASILEGLFPINLASRGIGLLPKEEYLQKFTDHFKTLREQVDDTNFASSLSKRIAGAKSFYSEKEYFNPYILGGLEIFEGQTSRNLMENPVASLLYTGVAPKFLSYQLNGVVKFVKKNNPYYEFLLAARELFAFDSFHVTQHKYPYGYLFHITEVKNKTPFPRSK
jgi:hypothetical protein